LRDEYAQAGKGARFAELKAFLLGEPRAENCMAVANRLEMTEQALKSAVFRLRGRFRELIRQEIARTVATPAEVDEELNYLVRLMAT
jgi:RNA polymerase sigma-70 factor (ECF subfamily)